MYLIGKPVRLIELFGGIGAQAKALENLGVNFEHYKLCEKDKKSVLSYNAIHNTNFEASDITKIRGKDLEIIDVDKYEYILTYSYPCTSISVAGKMEGMREGSGTQSSLLWEVKRLLEEVDNLPQILLMENVTQVHSPRNIEEFERWKNFLIKLGYFNFCKDLNAKDFGVPQKRNRCFMISILNGGENAYVFPEKIELKTTVKDLLESSVDEKYYIKTEKADELIKSLIDSGKLKPETIVDDTYGFDGVRTYKNFSPTIRSGRYGLKWLDYVVDKSVNCPDVKKESNCITAREDRGISNRKSEGTAVVEVYGCAQRGRYNMQNPKSTSQRLEIREKGITNCITTVAKDSLLLKKNSIYVYDDYNSRLYRDQNCCGTITTNIGNSALRNGQKIIINYELRKLTPKECFRLFGFSDEDFYNAASVNKDSVLYKQIGNSIVVNVLVAIFEQLFHVKQII